MSEDPKLLGSGGPTAEDGRPLPPDGSIRWWRGANGDFIVNVDAKDRAVLAEVFYRVFRDDSV